VTSVYIPAEDSYLLMRQIQLLAYGMVLDMGTGSGILAVTAAEKTGVSCVMAVDIDINAIKAAKQLASERGVENKIVFVLSDLFNNVEGHFDFIVFNPPYLPSEGEICDPTWVGGETGKETIERFLKEAEGHLVEGGSILLLYSSESNLDLCKYGYQWKILEEVSIFFETLYCAQLKPISNSS
jgi:release factor glutamine methyltransferase